MAGFAALTTPAAHAQEREPLKCYEAEFILEKQDFSAEPLWVTEKDPFFDARLLPRELFEVQQSVQVEGKELLRSGDQLMTMRSNIPVKCNMPQTRDNSIASRERICVFDPDFDGVFDRVFVRSRGGLDWFAMAWEHPKEPTTTIDPVAMEQVDPAQFKGGPSMFYYAYHTPFRRKPRDGSPAYFEQFTLAQLRGNDGLTVSMNLRSQYGYSGLRNGYIVVYGGMTMRVLEVAEKKAQVSYSGNFGSEILDLPFLNSYESKCDIYRQRF